MAIENNSSECFVCFCASHFIREAFENGTYIYCGPLPDPVAIDRNMFLVSRSVRLLASSKVSAFARLQVNRTAICN